MKLISLFCTLSFLLITHCAASSYSIDSIDATQDTDELYKDSSVMNNARLLIDSPAPNPQACSGVYSCYTTENADLPSRATMVNYINSARTDPTYWATLIQTSYSTLASDAEITATVAYLNSVTPLAALTENLGLDDASQLHANYLKGFPTGWPTDPHAGCNSDTPAKRMTAIGTWGVTCGENIVGGESSPEKMVALWLVDAGVPSRGHRLNIMKSTYTLIGIGISTGEGAGYSPTVVTDFAGSFTCTTGTCPSLPPMDVTYDCTTAYTACSTDPITGVSTIPTTTKTGKFGERITVMWGIITIIALVINF